MHDSIKTDHTSDTLTEKSTSNIDEKTGPTEHGLEHAGNDLTKPLEQHTRDELRQMAKALEIKGRGSMNKQALIEAINRH